MAEEAKVEEVAPPPVPGPVTELQEAAEASDKRAAGGEGSATEGTTTTAGISGGGHADTKAAAPALVGVDAEDAADLVELPLHAPQLSVTGCSRNTLLAIATASHVAGRYQDMAEAVDALLRESMSTSAEITDDEITAYAMAYKELVGDARNAVKAAAAAIAEDEHDNDDHAKYRADMIEFEAGVRQDLIDLCNRVNGLLHDVIEAGVDARALMRLAGLAADHHRYAAEALPNTSPQYKHHAAEALKLYEQALRAATALEVKPTDPKRLALALNFGVYHHDIANNLVAAIKTMKTAFEEAVEGLHDCNASQYKDATILMQLLRDNLFMWRTEAEAAGIKLSQKQKK